MAGEKESDCVRESERERDRDGERERLSTDDEQVFVMNTHDTALAKR